MPSVSPGNPGQKYKWLKAVKTDKTCLGKVRGFKG